MREEVEKSGGDFGNAEDVMAILKQRDKMASLKSKAHAAGITMGIINAASAGIGGLIIKGVGNPAVRFLGAMTAGAVGEAGGEFGAQVAAEPRWLFEPDPRRRR